MKSICSTCYKNTLHGNAEITNLSNSHNFVLRMTKIRWKLDITKITTLQFTVLKLPRISYFFFAYKDKAYGMFLRLTFNFSFPVLQIPNEWSSG